MPEGLWPIGDWARQIFCVYANQAPIPSATGACQNVFKTRAFQIGAQYPLSKRTTLQANYGINNTKNATAVVTPTGIANTFGATGTTGETKVRALNFGVAHAF